MTSESDLIAQARGGDTEAFGRLVQRYQDRLYTSVVHVIGCQEEARDIVQDAFVQSFVNLARFRGDSSFYTWVYRIALNAAITRRRRRRPVISIERPGEALSEDPADPHDIPADKLLREERVIRIQEALSQLSEEYRAVLVLREMDGYGYEAIAEMLELTVGTVRSRLHRARAQLRQHLKRLEREAT